MLSNNVEWILLVGIISIILNIVFFIYARKILFRVFFASEAASEIFTRLDSFQEHLQSIYEMPTFYGDDTLQGLLEHIKSLTSYLGQYEEVYSFTQPDLMEQLESASEELQDTHEQETQEKEE
tara:strand:- start:2308 stop:2676 length:369 start_codon:yes stop_codon:yes gene_type:complete